MNVGYADFVLLCQVNDPDTWDDALSVREDGVYVKPLTDDCAISPEERAVLAQHPSGNLNDPALRFPCTLDDLQRFLDEHGAYGCIDAFRMARWIQAARDNGQAADCDAQDSPSHMQPPKALPSSVLMPVIDFIKATADKVPGLMNYAEASDLFGREFNPKTMLYLRGGYGLATPLQGNTVDPNSGYNARADFSAEVYNSQWWDHPEALTREYKILEGNGIGSVLIRRADATDLERQMLALFQDERATHDTPSANANLRREIAMVQGRNNGQAWRRRLAAAEYLEHGEAAGALAGINWGDPHAPLSKQDHAEWRGWFKNIDQAIRSGSLRAFHGDIDEDGNEGPLLISPSEFKAWCESKGLGNPFSPGRPSLEDGARAAPRHLVEPESNQSQLANGLQSDASLREELARAHERIKALELDRTALLKKIEATASTPITSGADSINSPTLQRILEAVVTYPTWRAAQNQVPNLKTVLDWQDEQQRGKGNASRVAHVAHHVVAEHFGLKS